MSTLRLVATLSAILVLQLTASAGDRPESEPGTYKIGGVIKGLDGTRTLVEGVNKERYHEYRVASGSVVLENDKREVIAEGKLEVVERLLGVRAKKGATFFYVPLQEKYSTPDWTQKSKPQLATLQYTRENRWQVMDENFFFLFTPYMPFSVATPGVGESFTNLDTAANVKPTASITRYSVIQLPAGTFKMFGYTIKSGKDGATVKFSYGKVVGTKDCTASEDKSSKP